METVVIYITMFRYFYVVAFVDIAIAVVVAVAVVGFAVGSS